MRKSRVIIDLDEHGNVLTCALARFDDNGEKQWEHVRPFGPFDPCADELGLLAAALVSGWQLSLF